MKKAQFPVFGIHAVQSLLETRPESVLSLTVLKGRRDQKIETILRIARNTGLKVQEASRETLDKLVDEENHQGVVVFCKDRQRYAEEDLPSLLESVSSPAFLLILDGVQDPHNLGACFRSADAAGVHCIIAPKDNAVGITPVVAKVASGATERVPFIQVTNLARTLESLKAQGIWIYGADGEAKQNLFQTDLKGPVAIVLGAEGKGLRRLTRETCDALLKIPMQGSIESLNVSVATGVFLFEVVRQRIS